MARTGQQQDRQVAIREEQRRVAGEITALIEGRAATFGDVLPQHITVAEFKRTLLTAISTNPDLMYADRRTLINAAVKCASDGLLPDGRHAALVVYNTKIKERDPVTGLDVERKIDAVQYMPMVHGLRLQLRNSGEVVSAIAEAVHVKDVFRYQLGDNAFIAHEPPPLGEPRGDVIGAYAIIRLVSGEVIRDVMDRETIERARNQSRAKDSLMWKNFYAEGAKKTVMRRAAKQAPLSPKIMRLINRDDDPLQLGHGGLGGDHEVVDDHRQAEREPERPQENSRLIPPDDGPQFAVFDLDGVENMFGSAARACDAIRHLLGEAERMGVPRLEGFWESNQGVMDALVAVVPSETNALSMEYADALDRAKRKAAPPQQQQQQKQTREEPRQGQDRGPPDDGWPGPRTEPQGGAVVQGSGQRPETAANPADRNGGAAPSPADADRQSLFLEPPLKAGKPDWRAWAVAKMGPKVRQQRTTVGLSSLLGDNEQNLEQAKAGLSRGDWEDLDATIKEQWSAIGKLENPAP